MTRLFVILLLSGCAYLLSAQTFHSLIFEAEGGFAAPQYGAAAALRPGYELKYKHLLFHLSFGAAYHYTTTPMPDYDETTPAVDSEEYRLLAHSYYSHRVDIRQWVDLQASVQLGGEWERVYFLAGLIPSFYVYGKADIRTDIRVTGDYEKFIDVFEDMPNHGFTTMPYHTTASLSSGANLYAAAEIGTPIGEYMRIGAYGRYPVFHTAAPQAWSVGIKLTAVISWEHRKHYPCRCFYD